MAYETLWKVRFDDIDRAGILFYPALFNNIHRGVEDLLEDIGYSYYDMMDSGLAMPTVRAEADYHSPISYSDRVILSITPDVGKSSVKFLVEGNIEGEDEIKFEAIETHAMIDFETFETIPVPEDFQQKLETLS